MSMNNNRCSSNGQICRNNAEVARNASSATHGVVDGHGHIGGAEAEVAGLSVSDDAEATLTAMKSKGFMANEKEPSKDDITQLDCAICLQSCVHPVRLPCTHVFCFLCAKGAADRSHRCALCRQAVPQGYVLQPQLLPFRTMTSAPADINWYYEGVNGWWQYDERASAELEGAYEKKESSVDLLIAGHVYVVDFERMVQLRRTDPTRRRRVKRDRADIVDKKGIAGLKLGINHQQVSPGCESADVQQSEGADDAEDGINTGSLSEDSFALSGLEAELSSLSLLADGDASSPLTAISSPLYDARQDVDEQSSSDSDWQ